MISKKLCVLAIPLALAACSGRSGAEEAVRARLKDPDSAKFGEFYYNSKTGKACLTTNAKNSMGGYTGNSQSHLTKDKEGWRYERDGEGETPAECRKDADDPRTLMQQTDDLLKNLQSAADRASAR